MTGCQLGIPGPSLLCSPSSIEDVCCAFLSSGEYLSPLGLVVVAGLIAWADSWHKVCKESVVDVKRIGDRILALKLMMVQETMNIISAYAPQIGSEALVKEIGKT